MLHWLILTLARVGNRILLQKNSENRIGKVSIISRKKVLRGIPRLTEESVPKLGTEQNYMKKLVLQKSLSPANRIESVFLSAKCFGTEFWEFASIFVPRNGIRSCFFFAEWFGTKFQVLLQFCSTVRNSELFFLPRNGSEQNPESLLLFLFLFSLVLWLLHNIADTWIWDKQNRLANKHWNSLPCYKSSFPQAHYKRMLVV